MKSKGISKTVEACRSTEEYGSKVSSKSCQLSSDNPSESVTIQPIPPIRICGLEWLLSPSEVSALSELVKAAGLSKGEVSDLKDLVKTVGEAAALGSSAQTAPPAGKAGGLFGTAPSDSSAQPSQILGQLGPAPVSEDQLLRDLGVSTGEAAPMLAALELDGEITRQPGGLISIGAPRG